MSSGTILPASSLQSGVRGLLSSEVPPENGWRPAVPFAEGMRGTIQWYADHRDWWERVKSGEYRDYYERQYGER